MANGDCKHPVFRAFTEGMVVLGLFVGGIFLYRVTNMFFDKVFEDKKEKELTP